MSLLHNLRKKDLRKKDLRKKDLIDQISLRQKDLRKKDVIHEISLQSCDDISAASTDSTNTKQNTCDDTTQ